MVVTLDIKESAVDKILYFLNNLKSDIQIINTSEKNILDIEPVLEDDEDYQFMLKSEKERFSHPEDYGTMNDINWK